MRTIIAPVLLLFMVMPALAGIRSTGKYAGVVVFDRWDSCFIVSGPYLMYIADHEKGESVLIDASDVLQWENPGDGVIRKLSFLGAPMEEDYEPVEGLELELEPERTDGPVVRVRVTVRNSSRQARRIWLDALAPTVFYPKNPDCYSDRSESRSEALITRSPLEGGLSRDGWRCAVKYRFQVHGLSAEDSRFELGPGESRRFGLTLELSPGSYSFLMAYSHGVHAYHGIVSNQLGIDVTSKDVHIVPVIAGKDAP